MYSATLIDDLGCILYVFKNKTDPLYRLSISARRKFPKQTVYTGY